MEINSSTTDDVYIVVTTPSDVGRYSLAVIEVDRSSLPFGFPGRYTPGAPHVLSVLREWHSVRPGKLGDVRVVATALALAKAANAADNLECMKGGRTAKCRDLACTRCMTLESLRSQGAHSTDISRNAWRAYNVGDAVTVLHDSGDVLGAGIVLRATDTRLGWRYEVAAKTSRHVVGAYNLRSAGGA